MQPKITLYHFPASRSARARWILHETLGDDFEIKRLDLYKGDQYRSDFTALNPSHAVPAVEIVWPDGKRKVMTESLAIVAFFADTFPEKKLAPPATDFSEARSDYEHMLHLAGVSADAMLWQIRINTHLLPPAEAHEKTIERYKKKFVEGNGTANRGALREGRLYLRRSVHPRPIALWLTMSCGRAAMVCAGIVYSRDIWRRLTRREAFQKAFSDSKEFTLELPGGPVEASPFNG